jgi:hypothetical protein
MRQPENQDHANRQIAYRDNKLGQQDAEPFFGKMGAVNWDVDLSPLVPFLNPERNIEVMHWY